MDTNPNTPDTQHQQQIEPIQAAAPTPTGSPPPAHETTVPYERFTEVNERNKLLEQQALTYQQQLLLYQNNAPAPAAAVPAPAANPLREVITQLDKMGDEELLDKKTFTGVLTELVNGFETGAQQIRQDFQSTAMQNDPSYRELVGDGVTIAPALSLALKNDPTISQIIANSPNPQQTALAFARSAAATMPAPVNGGNGQNYPAPLNMGVIPNPFPVSQGVAPRSVSNVPSGTGQDLKALYANMTDEQLRAHQAQVMNQSANRQ